MRIMFIALLLASMAHAAPPTTRPAGPQAADQTAALDAIVGKCDLLLRDSPRSTALLQRRAEALCRLGRIDESVRDFDRVVALSPDDAPHNWQRGLALYYAGRFDDAAKQFEQHRQVNPQDVENAAWHYLCVARSLDKERGPAEALKKLIPIQRDLRVPLMKIHELYAGTATPADVIAAANAGKPDADELRERLFYAHLYIGLFHEAAGAAKEAAEHMRLAATTYGVDGYMGDIARLHAWRSAR